MSSSATASVRSGNRWEQEGFIPDPPLPPMPHKNLSFKDAMKLCQAWGCKMRVAKNDVLISHQLIDPRKFFPVPISVGRHDVSAAVVSYLRRVAETVPQCEEYKEKLRKHQADIEIEAEAKRVEQQAETESRIESLMAQADQHPTSNGQHIPVLEAQSPEIAPVTVDRVDHTHPWSSYEDTVQTLLNLANHHHYRQHLGPAEFVPLRECKHGECITAVTTLMMMEEDYSAVVQLRQDADGLVRLVARHQKELADLQVVVADLESKIPKTLQQVALERPLDGDSPTDVLLPNATRSIVEGDSLETRKNKLGIVHMLFMERLRSVWRRDLAVLTRFDDALLMLLAERNYMPALEDCYITNNWSGWKIHIMALKRDGGGRCLIGLRGWNDVMDALKVIRQKMVANG